MRAAHMNVVGTYTPWDYHQLGPDTWDFSGARDFPAFMELACARGFHVILKPGPLITGEWPRGFGSFGAVPEWWKAAHPGSLVRKADGSLYSYSPTGDERQRQPSYLDPDYLLAVRAWYEHILALARPYLGTCLIGLQVDNETNLYWSEPFGDVDYSPSARAFFAGWLAERYGGDIAALNARYHASYADFAAVPPPASGPGAIVDVADRRKNPALADWYWSGQALVHEYLLRLRGMIEDLGFREPDVLFITNDSPFALLADDVRVRNILVHDGPTKDPIGLAALDLYPKQFPLNGELQDQPFQADFHTRAYDFWGDLATGAQEYAFAIELQGGFYSFPVLGHPLVRPEATDQILARAIGHGLKGLTFYIIRDGWNADGSLYDFQSAIAESGATTARYDVMRRWGDALARHGASLLGGREVTSSVAILTDGRYAVPQAGVLDDMQRLHTIENPAIFGWLVNAGINPAVLDARGTTPEMLAAYDVVFFQDPDFVAPDTAALLTGYVAGGGFLVDLLWPGRSDDAFGGPSPLGALFPATESGQWAWPGAWRSGQVLGAFGDYAGDLESYWYAGFWSAPAWPPIEPFLWEKTAPFGERGKLVGYVVRDTDGLGTRAFIGTNVWARFDEHGYYTEAEGHLDAAAALVRWLVAQAGQGPLLDTGHVRQLAWPRRSGERLYLFVVNDTDRARDIVVRCVDLARLGLEPGRRYTARAVLDGDVPLGGARSGQALADDGLAVPVAPWATAVVAVDPE
ncbi:MAG: beta-galactosidase [Myxococcota bacterium]